jgi:hypothetical protein
MQLQLFSKQPGRLGGNDLVTKTAHTIALVEYRGADAQTRERRGELDAKRPGANHGQ